MRGWGGVLAVLVATALAGSPNAGAAFAGRNGRIVFASNRRADLQQQIFAVPAGGGAPRNVSRRPSYANYSPDARARGLLVYTAGPVTGYGEAGVWLVRGSGRPVHFADGIAAALSPDGTRVLYVAPQDRGMFVADVRTGRGHRVTAVSVLGAWSPDGRWIAYVDVGGVELVRADGSERRTIPSLYPQLSRSPWSPDGTKLVVEEGVFSDSSPDEHVISVVDAATGAENAIVSGSAPVWSPDGVHIALIHDDAIQVVRPDGTGLQRLTAPPADDGDVFPSWSPDGSEVAFVRLHPRLDASSSALGVVALAGGGVRFLTPTSGHLVDGFDGTAWSADGRTLYYASRSLNDVFHLFTVDANLRGLRQLTRGAGDDREPAWSPDRRRVAFVRNGRMLVVLDRGRERFVSDQADMSSPTWSPDGHRLAYAAGAALWIVDTKRPGRRGLVAGAQPTWSPRGGWIAYVRNGIRIVRANGTGDHSVVPDTQDVREFAPRWSPDGRTLYFLRGDLCNDWCGPPDGDVAAVDPFSRPPAEVRIPLFRADTYAVSPDGRYFVLGGGSGLARTPRSGSGTSFARLSYATETEPDW